MSVLREIRSQKGLTQQDLSKKTGITQALISWYETEKLKPSIKTIHKLAKAFKMPYEELYEKLYQN